MDRVAVVLSKKGLTVLPDIPADVTYLDCNQNQLTALPNPLPENLTELDCNNNKLTALPPLPATLIVLHCYTNEIRSLPPLPANLRHLSCSRNKLTELPPLPANLRNLYCGHNQLTVLPDLPASLEYFDCFINTLIEPYAGFVAEYERRNDINRLRNSVNTYNAEQARKRNIKARGRNVKAYTLSGITKKLVPGSVNPNGSVPRVGPNHTIGPNLTSHFAEFLSGSRAPSYANQMAVLRGQLGGRRTKKHRKSKKSQSRHKNNLRRLV